MRHKKVNYLKSLNDVISLKANFHFFSQQYILLRNYKSWHHENKIHFGNAIESLLFLVIFECDNNSKQLVIGAGWIGFGDNTTSWFMNSFKFFKWCPRQIQIYSSPICKHWNGNTGVNTRNLELSFFYFELQFPFNVIVE